MEISNNYVLVSKLEEKKEEGFQTVEVQDDFIYKGKVEKLPEAPVYMGNKAVTVGDVILFAKYSPDTHELEIEGVKKKFVSTRDILAVL